MPTNKCTHPNCSCLETERQRQGGQVKGGYPCLADNIDWSELMKSDVKPAVPPTVVTRDLFDRKVCAVVRIETTDISVKKIDVLMDDILVWTGHIETNIQTKKLMKIRYNTEQKGSGIWRVLIDNQEHLADNIRINVPTFNTTDQLPDGRVKYHFSCYYTDLQWNGTDLIVN